MKTLQVEIEFDLYGYPTDHIYLYEDGVKIGRLADLVELLKKPSGVFTFEEDN